MKINKISVQNQLIMYLEEKLKASESQYQSYFSETGVKLNEVRDSDDVSHKIQNEDFTIAFDKQLHVVEHNLEKISSIDFSEKTAVGPGAVVKMNSQHYIIGIPACRFDFEGVNYIAMSTEAPLYLAIEGTEQGDTAEYNDQVYKIEKVY